LEELGLVQVHDRVPFGPSPSKRRGRPSSSYSLSDQGRKLLKQSYNDLALESLEFLERSYGREAVRVFAAERAQRIITGKSIPDLVNALNAEGYEATFEQAGVSGQLCQHHCPVVDAARAYPELCEEETRALGESLGTHPTRLATLAHGDPICTTLIPLQHFLPLDKQVPSGGVYDPKINTKSSQSHQGNGPLMEEVST
jgi:predicted ArsR family transcriptional regulator